jgi:16S rRNA (cytosine967-C5)-methyltransferase
LSARRAALTALRVWRKEPQPADGVIRNLLAEETLSVSDRAFALELFYGVLRNITLLDFWMACLRRSRLDPDVRDVARIGLYQLLLLNTPEHAAVYESVELAPHKHRAVINGILRNAARQREILLSKTASQPLSVRRSHPEFLIQRWEKNFGRGAASALCQWNNEPSPVYARINTLKIDEEEFVQRYTDARRSSGHPKFVEFSKFPSEALKRGHCYIQDPSTTIACELLNPQVGERLLDACAAPGGKTVLLAQKVKNRAVIIACDRDQHRIDRMRQNFRRLGVTVSSLVQCDWTRDPGKAFARLERMFDRILVDAPCTNTGVMRRRVDVRWRLQPEDFDRMRKQQLAIVRATIPFLKPNGVLVYSTCSLEPEENQQVLEQLLAEFPGMRLIEKKATQPFRDNIDGAFAAKLTADKM